MTIEEYDMETTEELPVVLPDGRTVTISELGGLADVALHYGWVPSTVTTWANRYPDAPQPVARWKRGDVYVIADWVDWNPHGKERWK
jgi:hypothetical protein